MQSIFKKINDFFLNSLLTACKFKICTVVMYRNLEVEPPFPYHNIYQGLCRYRSQDDERASEGSKSEPTPLLHDRSYQRPSVLCWLPQRRRVASSALLPLLLPCSRSGETQVWPVGMEHPVRVQRVRSQDQCHATTGLHHFQ